MKIYILFTLLISSLYITAETITLSTQFKDHEDEFRYVEKYYKEVASNIDGLDIVIRYLPLERGITYLEKEKIDRDSARNRSVYDNSKNVIRVETPVLIIDYIFLSSDPLPENIPEDLTDGRVIITRGALARIEYLESHGLEYNVVTSADIGFKMLKNRRAKYFLCPSFTTNFLEDNSNFYISEAVFRTDVFLYIHKRHEKWIPELNRVLKMLSDTGQNLELLGYSSKDNK